MRVTRLFHPDPLNAGTRVSLGNEASAHLVRVLRMPAGSEVILFNGDDRDYLCTTLDENAKHTSLQVESVVESSAESTIHSTLIQCLSKQDRMETTIQKCVELGVSRVIPVTSVRSNVKLDAGRRKKKVEHWRRVAISACEQCGRNRLPVIEDICTLTDACDMTARDSLRIILDPGAEQTLQDIDAIKGTLAFTIGPEGGLDDSEFNYLLSRGFERIKFGPRVLRTETAGPALLSAIQVLWGDCR